MKAEIRHKLFDIVRELVLESGEDGDGWIVSSQYKELARQFEEYELQNSKWFASRHDGEMGISFSNAQESITFCESLHSIPDNGGDITVLIDYYGEAIR